MGAGINGVGWGTAVTRENVWVSSFNGKILVMDLQGRPVASEQDFPFRENLSGLMGIGVAANGDVWITDSVGNQLLFFPGGRVKEGRIVKVAGLAGSSMSSSMTRIALRSRIRGPIRSCDSRQTIRHRCRPLKSG
jgi:hypothetical protein